MALNINTLATEMKTEIETQFGAPADSAQLQKFCLAISTAVVTHIIANAVVTSTTLTPNAQSGSTALAGTATGTIT